MALDVLRAEFQKSRLLYSYNDNRVFFSSHWKIPHPIFVAIRVVLALYTMYALTHYLVLYSIILTIQHNIMVYFTSWSYVLLTAHMALAALLSIVCYKHVNYERPFKAGVPKVAGYQNTRQSDHVEMNNFASAQPTESVVDVEKSESANSKAGGATVKPVPPKESNVTTYESLAGYSDPIPKYTKCLFMISWILSDIELCAAPVVTIIYFTAIYPYITYRDHVDLQDLNVHILNSVVMLIDFAMGARPVRLLHCWVPVVYGFSWGLFSLLYWSTDHEKHIVYKFIDWNKPAATLAWTGGLAVVLIIFMFLFFGLYRLKVWLYSIIHKEEFYVAINED